MIPYVRDIEIEYGRCDQVSPLIRRVTANNPGPFTFKGTGTRSTYLWALAEASRGGDAETLIAQAGAAGYDLSSLRPHL